MEIDIVAPDPENPKGLVVGEVKWSKLTAADRRRVEGELRAKWQHCKLAERHPTPRFLIFDASGSVLKAGAKRD